MRKLLFVVLLILPSVVFSQQPFRYDTIRVSNDDTRNIHHKQQHTLRQRNQKRLRSSQSNTKSQFDARNLRYGLNLGLNFSNDYTFFRIAPQLGYQFNKYFMAGAGVSYYYSKRKYYYSNESRHNNSLGANLFGYIYPASFLAISIQPEVNYIWNSYREGAAVTYKKDVLVPSVVIGDRRAHV